MAVEYPDGLRSELDADLNVTFRAPPVTSSDAASGKLSGTVTVLRGAYREPMAVMTQLLATLRAQQLAADALTRIGPPAVPMLVEALRGTDGEVRRQACEVLMRMGPDARGAVPELVRLLDDQDEELRRMAATALGRIGPDAGEAVPALMRQLLEGETLPPPGGEPQRLPPQ